VNGIRSVVQKGFWDFVQSENPDVLCLQEVKAFYDQAPLELLQQKDYQIIWHNGTRPGYAGTAIFSKKTPSLIKTIFPENDEFHIEGRVTEVRFDKLVILNIYFPNGGDRADGTEMLSYKLNFYASLFEYLRDLKAQDYQIIVTGDFNICHTPIDIANPEANKNSIGFLPIERAHLTRLRDEEGFTDVFRHFYPEQKNQYTWWSYRAGARARNVGWRLDFFWVSPNLIPYLNNIFHRDQVLGSDHCPVSLDLNF